MKKSIIALAVAGAMTAPIIAQADATLYGRIHERVVFQEDKDMAIQSAGTRLGVKGSSEMDSGLTAFYQLETSFGDPSTGRSSNSSTNDSSTLSVRQMNAGVKGDFGKVIIGRFTNPSTAVYVADIFEHNSGPYQLTPFRIGNALAYSTPTVNGLNATIAIIGEGEGDDSNYEDVDGAVLQVGASFGAITVNAAYTETNYGKTVGTVGPDKSEVAGIGFAYNANNIYAGLSYEEDDIADEDVIDFSVKYTAGKTGFGLGYAIKDSAGKEEDDRVMVGVYHDLGGSADTYVELAQHNNTDTTGADTDFNRLTIGYRVKF